MTRRHVWKKALSTFPFLLHLFGWKVLSVQKLRFTHFSHIHWSHIKPRICSPDTSVVQNEQTSGSPRSSYVIFTKIRIFREQLSLCCLTIGASCIARAHQVCNMYGLGACCYRKTINKMMVQYSLKQNRVIYHAKVDIVSLEQHLLMCFIPPLPQQHASIFDFHRLKNTPHFLSIYSYTWC